MGTHGMRLDMSTHLYATSMCSPLHLESRQCTGFDQQHSSRDSLPLVLDEYPSGFMCCPKEPDP